MILWLTGHGGSSVCRRSESSRSGRRSYHPSLCSHRLRRRLVDHQPGHCSPSSLYLLHGRRPFVTFRICQGTPQIQNPSRGHPAGRCHQFYFDCDRLHQLHCLGFIDFTGRMLHDWLSGLYGTEKTVSGNETPLQGSLWNLGMLHHHFRLSVHALFADKIALYTAGILSVLCIIFWYFYTQHKKEVIPSLEEEIGEIEEPSAAEKEKWIKSTLFGNGVPLS